MVAVPVDVCPVLLTRVAAGRHQVLMRDDAPGPNSSIGGSPRWAYCAISGGSFKQVPISQGLSAAFFSAGWPGTGPGKRRKIRLRAPRPPPWAGGEIAANLECLLYIYSGFSLSTHIADPSCARLMWPGPTVVCSILHNPPTRRVGGAFCTTTICGSVFPWWSRRRSRQNRRASREHAVAVAYSAGRVSSCTSGRTLHSADCGCGPSRPARLR